MVWVIKCKIILEMIWRETEITSSQREVRVIKGTSYSKCLKEIQGKSILVGVSASFELVRVRGPWGPFELSGVAITISRPETQTKKLKLTLANSPLFILKNVMFACLLSLNWEKWQNSDKNCKLVTMTSFARHAISALGTGKDRRHFLRNLGMIVQNGGHFGECRYVLAWKNVLWKTSELIDV